MKNKLFLVSLLLLCPFSATSCEPAEDGDINEWVGEYQFTSNNCKHCHHYVVGGTEVLSTEKFKMDTDHFFIYTDKTWKIPDSKGLGPKGTIRCYKDHINLLDFSMDYRIESKYDFKIYKEMMAEQERTYLRYYRDESEGRITGDYDFDIREVRFWLK